MNVSKVKKAAAGIAFAALAVATANIGSAGEARRDYQRYDCSDQTKCSNGQRAFLPYVINPYQVFQSEEDGVHYFKGGSGFGYGYDRPQVNYPETNYFTGSPRESSIALIQPQFLNMDRPVRKHLPHDQFSIPGVNPPAGHLPEDDALELKKPMKLPVPPAPAL